MSDKTVNYRKLPIACLLPNHEQAKRREKISNDIFKRAEEIQELRDGFSFRYPGTDKWISKISEFIMFERKCCPFFTFELLFASNNGPVYLYIRGSKDVKEIIKKGLLQLKSS
jgi:hypothetical protein